MKTVLILAYDFAPYNSIAAMRPAGWIKYLYRFGWFPVVVTRHWDEGVKDPIDHIKPSSKQQVEIEETETYKIIRVPYQPNLRDKLILEKGMDNWVFPRKLMTAISTISKYQTFLGDNTANIFHEALKWLKSNSCQAIAATCEPFWLFRYAHLLSQKTGLPWLADYRDGWTTDPKNLQFSKSEQWFIQNYFAPVEKRYVSSASVITTASPSYSQMLKPIFPGKQIESLVNGYDEEVFEQVEKAEQDSGTFEIAYAGRLYDFQPVEVFLEGLKIFLFKTGAENVNVKFYGPEFYPEQKERILNYDTVLQPFLETLPRLPYKDVLNQLQTSNCLLLLASDKLELLAGKIFDYLALNRKILMVKNDHGVLESLIDECQGGVKCDNAQDVVKSLESMYSEFQETGMVKHQSTGFEKYSRKEHASLLASFLTLMT